MVMSKILVRNMEVIKEQIRRDFKTRRRTLSCEHVRINSDKICENFLDSDIYKNCQNILAYSTIQNEVDLSQIINQALLDNKNLFLPRVEGDSMNFFRINNTDKLQIGSYNILEPQNGTVYQDSTNSIMLVPGIAFSTEGAGIGFGKGFYDKYLSQHKSIFKIGIAYDWQITKSWVTNEFDINMNMIITEKREVKIYD